MISKGKEIVVKVERDYGSQNELCEAVVKQRRQQGDSCEALNSYTILLNGVVYTVKPKTVTITGEPVPHAILKEKA